MTRIRKRQLSLRTQREVARIEREVMAQERRKARRILAECAVFALAITAVSMVPFFLKAI